MKSAPTFMGWTPGLRSLVAGRVLDCGCLVGLYETRDGQCIEILDAKGLVCRDSLHLVNAVGTIEDETH